MRHPTGACSRRASSCSSPLAPLLGHSWDTKIFMATGYLVGSGQTPYLAHNLTAVFHHAGFSVISSVGYPPPWPLVLGLLYRGVYAVAPNLIVYNFAIKLPLICAGIGLAYLVAALLISVGAGPAAARRAWVFLLFNPFLLYVGAAWGQIDVHRRAARRGGPGGSRSQRRVTGSAVLLALAVCCQADRRAHRAGRPRLPSGPLARPGGALRGRVRRRACWLSTWRPSLPSAGAGRRSCRRLNDHFVMNGTMSLTTVARLVPRPHPDDGPMVAARPGLGARPRGGRRRSAARRRRLRRPHRQEHRPGADLLSDAHLAGRAQHRPGRAARADPHLARASSTGALSRPSGSIPLAFTVFNASPLQLLWVAIPWSRCSARWPSSRSTGTRRSSPARRSSSPGRSPAGGSSSPASEAAGGRRPRRRRSSRAVPRRAAAESGAHRGAERAAVRRPFARRSPTVHRTRAVTPATRGATRPRGCRGACCSSAAGRDLAEEGVGFGVPVLKRGAQTVFAGAMELRRARRRADVDAERRAEVERRACARRRQRRLAGDRQPTR